jgi:hypothetical protein
MHKILSGGIHFVIMIHNNYWLHPSIMSKGVEGSGKSGSFMSIRIIIGKLPKGDSSSNNQMATSYHTLNSA